MGLLIQQYDHRCMLEWLLSYLSVLLQVEMVQFDLKNWGEEPVENMKSEKP